MNKHKRMFFHYIYNMCVYNLFMFSKEFRYLNSDVIEIPKGFLDFRPYETNLNPTIPWIFFQQFTSKRNKILS